MRGTPRVLIVADKTAVNNPMLLMYIRALRGSAELTVCCNDPSRARELYPDVDAVVYRWWSAEFLWYEFMRFVKRSTLVRDALAARKARRLAAAPPPPTDAPAPPPVPPPVAAASRPRKEPRPAGAPAAPRRGRVGFDWRAVFRLVSQATLALLRLVLVRRHDAIILIDGPVLLAGRALGALWRVPYYYVTYEIWPNEFSTYSAELSNTLATIERLGIRGSAQTIVADPRWLTLLVRRYKIPREKFALATPCAVLPEPPSPPVVRTPMRFLYQGMLWGNRGIENLVLAMRQVRGGELAIRGAGPLVPALRALIAQHGLEDRVRLHDAAPVEQLATLATEADVGVNIVCPSNANHRFNLAFKTFENLAAGVALLCYRSHCLGPLVRRNDVGLTFTDCAVDTVAAAMQHCVDHPDDVVRWKRNARALAERWYNRDTQAAELRRIVLAPLAR